MNAAYNDGNKSIALTLGQDLFLRIMTAFMSGQDYDEELKIDIANAMGNGELGINGEDYEQ